MKKLSITLVAAGLVASLGAYAAQPTGAAPFQVVVPNLKSGVDFTLEGLYLQPTNSDLDYVSSFTFPTTGNLNANMSTADPDYNFGFRVGLGYVFPDSGNDVQAAWTHFDNSDTDNTNFTGAAVVIPHSGVFPASLSATDTETASSDANFNYDAVDLDVGQYVSIGTRLQTRLFAGLRYAQVKNDLTDTYTGTVTDTDIATITGFNENDYYYSKFTGVGPRFGMDMAYHVGNCFGVVGHVAAALLVGRVESSSTFSNTTSAIPTGADLTTAVVNLTSDNATRIVPALDAKLGVDFTVPVNQQASAFTIEAGWQVTQYLDAVDRLNANELGSVSRTTSSVGFDGPYLSLNYRV